VVGGAPLPGGEVVYLGAGGMVTNGSAADTGAFIGNGSQNYVDNVVVAKTMAATVTNFGSMVGGSFGTYNNGRFYLDLSTAINLEAGGKVTNGTAADTAAYISGVYGIVIGAARGTVTNNGSIDTYFYYGRYVPPTDYQPGYTNTYFKGVGVTLDDGGVVTNGSAGGAKAEIFAAYSGVEVTNAAGTVRNFGTIETTGSAKSVSVSLGAGGDLINGSATDSAALILSNHVGVALTGVGVVTNYGTIHGYGAAVLFSSSADRLVLEAGSLIDGYVGGAGGTLDLASGAGQIDQLAEGDVSLHGSPLGTNFFHFGTVEIGSGAQFTLAGGGAIGAGATSTLDVLGTLAVTGSLASAGKITGPGTLSLQGGQTSFNAGNSLSVTHVAVSGAATVAEVATNLAYAGTWEQTGGTVSVATGDKLTFTATGDSFTGTLAGAGDIAFSGGSDAFSGLTLSANRQTIGASTITLSGAIALTTTLTVTTPSLIVAAAGASLTGGGEFLLSDTAGNAVTGASATAKLTNVSDRILGAGLLGNGKMSLLNEAAGTIDANDALALTINTGIRIVTNAGLIEATGAGGLTILSAVNNTGTLTTTKGVLAVDGAVSGAGTVRIAGGTADFGGTFTENVTFVTKGELELAHSQAYTGTISGFSLTGATSLDLKDISFISGTTKATYSGTTTSGTLTVTDGTHTAKIKLSGNYTASSFDVSSDGHGGTTVVDPPAAAQAHAFVAAMAGFAPSEAATAGAVDAPAQARPPLLLASSPDASG